MGRTMIAVQKQRLPAGCANPLAAHASCTAKIIHLKPMVQRQIKDNPVRQAQLIRGVARKDNAAFAALFEFFAPRIKAMMMRGGVAESQAEVLAQETMLTVWRKADLYDPKMGSAAAWIYTIARNRRIDQARSAQRAPPEASEEEVDQVDEQPLPDETLVAAEISEKVRGAMKLLSEEQQEVLRLSYFEDLSQSEISQVLGLPIGTVKSRTRLAFRRLRDMLGDFK